ncbi:ProQ/FINO family protein [Undibacterium arcticum]|uniref:ProQ/FINO family protein n=1 Tax=Undibacterium arcticum TaxID=1762892 RepID=UPI003612D9A4
MNTANPTPSPFLSARALLKEFQEKFAVRECMPLAIGIDKQLIAQLPALDRKALRTALGIHTNSLRYLKGMAKATVRFDLDGNTAGEVTETHRTHASTTLQERIKKDAERRKAQRKEEDAQRKAEDAQREADQAARQRSEKLNQLTAKFSRRGS